MCKTLSPKKSDHVEIEGEMRNLPMHVAHNKLLDIEDFFIRNLMHSASNLFVPKIYAP